MESAEKVLENDKVKVLVKREARCQVTLEVSVSPQQTQAVYKKALKSVRKQANIPGFRKGKAPDRLILDHYASHVDREFRENILEDSFSASMELTKLYPLNRNTVRPPEVRSVKKDEGAELCFKYECEPEMPEVDLESLELKQPEASKIRPETLEKRIEELRYYHADWQEVTDRGIQAGDFIDADINTTATPAFNICSHTRFKIEKGAVPQWMFDLVQGAKKGDELVGESAKDENFESDNKALDFQPTEVKVTIQAVHQAELPPVDDDLAKKAGVDDVDTLKKRIEEHIELQAQEAVKDLLRTQLEDQLLEKYHFELPASVYDSERSLRVRKLIEQLRDENASEEDIKGRQEEIEKMASDLTDRNLRLYFITLPSARKLDLGADQTEMLTELYRVNALPMHERLIDKDMDHEVVRFRLFSSICTRKVIDDFLNQVKVS